MKLNYRTLDEYINVDISQLRPKDSYDKLIKKRLHIIEPIIKKFGKIPDELLFERDCPTCGSKESNLEMEKDYMKIVRCRDCDLVYVNPVFDFDHYKKIYANEDYQEIMSELQEASHDYRVKRFGNERVEIMNRFIGGNKTAKYLDVGCSTGFVVEAARNVGWDSMGIDLNPSAIKFGIKEKNLNLQNISLEELDIKEHSFDAISLFEVIEHLTNPIEILQKAITSLKDNGILFIYVPNYDSAFRILLGKEAHFIWPTHHLNYYTPKTIMNLLERLGMKIELLVTEGLDMQDFIWYEENVSGQDMSFMKTIANKMQFFINAGCYGKNLRVVARKTS